MANLASIGEAQSFVPSGQMVSVTLANGKVVKAKAITPITQSTVAVSFIAEQGQYIATTELPLATQRDVTIKRKQKQPAIVEVGGEFPYKALVVNLSNVAIKGADNTQTSLGTVADPNENFDPLGAIAIINQGLQPGNYFAFITDGNDLSRIGNGATVYADWFDLSHHKSFSWRGHDGIVSSGLYTATSNETGMVENEEFRVSLELTDTGIPPNDNIPITPTRSGTTSELWESDDQDMLGQEYEVNQTHTASQSLTTKSVTAGGYLPSENYQETNSTFTESSSGTSRFTTRTNINLPSDDVETSGMAQNSTNTISVQAVFLSQSRVILEQETLISSNSYSYSLIVPVPIPTPGEDLAPNSTTTNNLSITGNYAELMFAGNSWYMWSEGNYQSTRNNLEKRIIPNADNFYTTQQLRDCAFPTAAVISSILQSRCKSWSVGGSLFEEGASLDDGYTFTVNPQNELPLLGIIPSRESVVDTVKLNDGTSDITLNTQGFSIQISNSSTFRDLMQDASLGDSFTVDVNTGFGGLGVNDYLSTFRQVPLDFAYDRDDINQSTGKYDWPASTINSYRDDVYFNTIWNGFANRVIDIFWFFNDGTAFKFRRYQGVLNSVTFDEEDQGQNGILRFLTTATFTVTAISQSDEAHIGGGFNAFLVSQNNYYGAIRRISSSLFRSRFYNVAGVPTIATTQTERDSDFNRTRTVATEILQLDGDRWVRGETQSGTATAIAGDLESDSKISGYFE